MDNPHSQLFITRISRPPPSSQSASADSSPASVSTSTVVNQFITQPIIEREMLADDAITRAELDTALASLRTDLLATMQRSLPSVYTMSSPAPATFAPVSTQVFAHSQKIDQLGNVTLTNATVNGVTGLTDADIPDTITASNYLPLSGGTLTTASSSRFSVFDKAYFGGTATSSFDSLGSLALVGMLSVSTTTATSTISTGGFSIGSGQFVVQQTSGNVGVGTTSPGSIFSIGSIANFTTATSTFYSAGGIDLTGGCFSVGGTCLSTSGASPSAANTWTALQNFSAGASTTQLSVSTKAYFGGTATSTFDTTGSLDISQFASIKQAGTTILYASSTNSSVLVGQSAGALLLSSDTKNTAMGFQAMANASGGGADSANSAFGYRSLTSLTTGTSNSCFGDGCLFSVTTGSNNTGIGTHTMLSVTGSSNTAMGSSALANGTTGAGNTAIGYLAMNGAVTGDRNVAVGYSALLSLTSGATNIAIGDRALQSLSTGSNNVALGQISLFSLTTGSSNIAIGDQAGYGSGGNSASSVDTYSTFIGYQASRDSSVDSATVLTNATAIGKQAKVAVSNAIVLGGTGAAAVKVGVGTTTPWRELSISGTVGFDGLTGSTGAGSLCLTANKEVVYNSASDACLPSLRDTKHDINPLVVDALSQVLTLQPVSFVYNEGDGRTRYGFIAEDTAGVDEHLTTYSASGTLSGIDDRSILAVVVKAIQELAGRIDSFAQAITSAVGNFGRVNTDQLNTDQLCVGSTCVNEAQLAALLANAGNAGSGSNNSPAPSNEGETDTEAPTITINGNNPAVLQVGDAYSDLGATVTDNVGLNLGYQTFLGSTPMEFATLDTSEPNEWHIHYVATDNAGNTATSTRTVIVEAPSIVPDEPAEPEEQQEEEQEQEEEPASQ